MRPPGPGAGFRAAIAALVLIACCAPAQARPEQIFPQLSAGWLMFGDLYTVPDHHLPTGQDATGAVMRRAYLTFDAEFSDRLFGRLRFEANQDGEFEEYGMDADFKDLYLGLSLGDHKLAAGLLSTHTYDVVENLWGARYLMRTPLDLQGIASRDTGISLTGPLVGSGALGYRVLLGSRAEFGRDSSDASQTQVAISWHPAPAWTVDFYVDFRDRADYRRRNLAQVFVGRQGESSDWGVLYAHRNNEDGANQELASVFIRSRLWPRIGLVGRIDRLFEPSVRGNDIDYLPFDPSAPATLYLAGVEWYASEHVRLTPNVVYTHYDRNDQGTRPQSDLYLRLTLFLDFE